MSFRQDTNSLSENNFRSLEKFSSRLINCSLAQGTYPESFKIANMNPRLKKPSLDPEVLNNYQPLANKKDSIQDY